MANIQINIIENGKTTLATQGCICDRNIDINVEVPNQGFACDGRHIPDDALFITGSCDTRFAYDGWTWFIRDYGEDITTEKITTINYMFRDSPKLTSVPFDINGDPNSTVANQSYVFNGCSNLEEVKGKISNLKVRNMQNFFYGCYKLRYLPEFVDMDFSDGNTFVSANMSGFCSNCYSLREVSEDLLKQIYGIQTSVYFTHLSGMFNNCYTLDEIKGISPRTGAFTANAFTNTFTGCNRVKDIIFDTQEDGTPYVANWKNQTIDLSNGIGYCSATYSTSSITGYNSGITNDTRVVDVITYNDFKDNPDWWTTDVAFSRYNHDSAVATINSLPDTSAVSGGTNIIKFKGVAGSDTDGGAINTLTEEEIAVATAKGWTVKIV